MAFPLFFAAFVVDFANDDVIATMSSGRGGGWAAVRISSRKTKEGRREERQQL